MMDVYVYIMRNNPGWCSEPEDEQQPYTPPPTGFRNYTEDELIEYLDNKIWYERERKLWKR